MEDLHFEVENLNTETLEADMEADTENTKVSRSGLKDTEMSEHRACLLLVCRREPRSVFRLSIVAVWSDWRSVSCLLALSSTRAPIFLPFEPESFILSG